MIFTFAITKVSVAVAAMIGDVWPSCRIPLLRCVYIWAMETHQPRSWIMYTDHRLHESWSVYLHSSGTATPTLSVTISDEFPQL